MVDVENIIIKDDVIGNYCSPTVITTVIVKGNVKDVTNEVKVWINN